MQCHFSCGPLSGVLGCAWPLIAAWSADISLSLSLSFSCSLSTFLTFDMLETQALCSQTGVGFSQKIFSFQSLLNSGLQHIWCGSGIPMRSIGNSAKRQECQEQKESRGSRLKSFERRWKNNKFLASSCFCKGVAVSDVNSVKLHPSYPKTILS